MSYIHVVGRAFAHSVTPGDIPDDATIEQYGIAVNLVDKLIFRRNVNGSIRPSVLTEVDANRLDYIGETSSGGIEYYSISTSPGTSYVANAGVGKGSKVGDELLLPYGKEAKVTAIVSDDIVTVDIDLGTETISAGTISRVKKTLRDTLRQIGVSLTPTPDPTPVIDPVDPPVDPVDPPVDPVDPPVDPVDPPVDPVVPDPTPEAVILFSEVTLPLSINQTHPVSSNLRALFVVDATNGTVKDLVSGVSLPATSIVTDANGSTFKEPLTFTSLFSMDSLKNTTIITVGDIYSGTSTDLTLKLFPVTGTQYLELRPDAHWDTVGYSKFANGFGSLGTLTTSPHSGLTDLGASLSLDTAVLYNDSVMVDTAAMGVADITAATPMSITVGSTKSALSFVVLLDTVIDGGQYATIVEDINNLLTNTGTGLTVTAGEAPAGGSDAVATVTLSPLPVDGIYLNTARKVRIAASHANSTAYYDEVEAVIAQFNFLTGDYTAWYQQDLHNRVYSLMTAYHINQDPAYMTKAKDAYIYRYLTTKWEQTNDTYTGRNNFRGGGPTTFVLYTWLKQYFTTQENADLQVEFEKWANYWLTFVNYDTGFAGANWTDTDELTSLAENFLLMALIIDDPVVKNKCTVAFEYKFDKVNVHLIDDICAGGFWAEGMSYNANTMKNYFRTVLLANELTDKVDSTVSNAYAIKAWLAYKQQHMSLDSADMWFWGDIEGVTPLLNDQAEGRYISFYDVIGANLAGTQYEAEVNYFRNMLATPAGGYYANTRLLFLDSTVTAVKPVSSSLYHFEPMSMGQHVVRDNWTPTSTIGIMSNYSYEIDHMHLCPLNVDIYWNGAAVTKQMTAYAIAPPFNGCFVENHSGKGQSSLAYLKGKPKQVAGYSNTEYAVMSGDTYDTFNQVGWLKVTFCSQLSRTSFIHYPTRTIVTHDRIVTDENVVSDIGQTAPYARKAERHHRFLHKTNPPILANGVYTGEYNGVKQHYQSMLTSDSVEITEEETNADYAGLQAYTFPIGERGWQVREHVQSSDAEFLSVMNYGDTNVVPAPAALVTVDVGDVIGVVINTNTMVLFNRVPLVLLTGPITVTSTDVPGVTTVFINGVDAATAYDVSVSGNTITLTVGTTFTSNTHGTVKVTI